MTIPGWLLSKPALYAGAVVLALGAAAGLKHNYDKKVRAEAVAADHVRYLEAARVHAEKEKAAADREKQAAQDSLVKVRARSDSERIRAGLATKAYAELRAHVDPKAPQPEGVPEGFVIVPREYVAAADSLARIVESLTATMQAEREASDRRIAASDRRAAASDSIASLLSQEVQALKVQLGASRPGMGDTVAKASVGGVVVYVLVKVFGHK